MKTKLLKIQLLGQLFCAIIFIVLIVIGLASNSYAASIRSSMDNLKIEYLKPIHLDISSNGINRINFGDNRIVKIVGDSSQYSALLSDNGCDLFLTSKLPPSKTIDLTLITARSQSIDLRLRVNNSPDGAIVNINLAGKNEAEQKEREEITAMIKAMKSNSRGKYYVEEEKRFLKVHTRSGAILKQYVSYRYGDLMGIGFVYEDKENSRLSTEDLRKIFANIVAISIVDGHLQKGEYPRVFMIFKAWEEMDV